MVTGDTYLTIANISKGVFKDKGSKFIALAYPVKTEEDVKEVLSSLRKEYYDARHHCYAYALGADGSNYRFNDDGEPSGSAGRPIHNTILSNNLTYILVVVIRYFGGIKLGVPGLIHAYKQATADAFSNGQIIMKIVMEVYTVHFDYLQINNVMKILKDEHASILEQSFDNQCSIKFSIRKSLGKFISGRLLKLTNVTVDLQSEI